MKIKSASLFLALVMIVSAFAGTFTVSAEGETAAPWSVNGARYETFDAAVDAAVGGDTIYLHEDTKNTIETNAVYYINKDVTIEGVAKADGSYPTLGIQIRWRRYAVTANGDDDYVEVLFKNMTIDFLYAYNYLYMVGNNCSLTFDNVDIVLTQGHTSNVYGATFLVAGNDSELTFRNSTVTAKDKYYPCQDYKALIAFYLQESLSEAPSGNLITIDNTQINLKSCMKTCGLFWTKHTDNTLVIRNSTIDTTDDAEVLSPSDFPVNLRGTNVINGVTSVNEDIDYLIYDRQAKDLGYVARVGEVKDAIKLDEQGNVEYIGYYKDLVAACKASAATETEKQKEVTLIDNVTVTENLTIPSAKINGNNKTLTAPRIYKEVDAILEVASLTIVTTTENPIFQMNGDSEPAEGEVAPAPSYAKFTKCTFTTDQAVPYAYFVLQANLILNNCEIQITNAECEKPIFRLDKGADVTLTSTKLNVVETAPKLIGFDVVSDGGSAIILNGATDIRLATTAFTASSKANVSLALAERAALTTTKDSISVGAEATGWKILVNGAATVTADKGAAIVVSAPNTDVSITGTAKVTGGTYAIRALGAGVTVTVDKDASVELVSKATSKAAISLAGEGSKLVSEGTITALKTSATVYSLELVGAKASALIKGGTLNNAVSVGTADAAAAFVMTGGKVVAQEKAASAIILTNGSADILSGTLSGAAAAITGQKEVAYAEGTTEITLNEIYEKIPLTGGTSMRMNDGSLGMRFTSSADAAAVAYAKALKEAGAIADYEFGTLIVRATEIRNTEMTVAALSAANVVYAAVTAKDGIVAAEDGSITYTAAVINFTEDNMGTALVARAYLKYTLIDGSSLYVYAAENTEATSIGELAQKCLADVAFESAEGYRNPIQEYYEADEDGWYELVQKPAYSPYSKEQREALMLIVEYADL